MNVIPLLGMHERRIKYELTVRSHFDIVGGRESERHESPVSEDSRH